MNHQKEEEQCIQGHDPGYEIKEILVLEMGNQEFVYESQAGDGPSYETVESEREDAGPECIIEEEDVHIKEDEDTGTITYNVPEKSQKTQAEEDGLEQPACPLKRKRGRRSKGGRADDDVWNYFTYSRDKKGKKVDLKCIYCHYRAKWPKIERLRTHYYESCPGATQDAITEEAPSVPEPSPEALGTVNSVRRTKSALDTHIGRFIFSSNLPFSVIENPEFVKLIKTLKPSYKLPTRRKLETSILDRVYDEVVGRDTFQNNGKYAAVLQDGWGTPVLTHTVSFECKITRFLNAVPFSDSKMGPLLLEAVKECERLHGRKVLAVVTDNLESIASVAQMVQEVRPDICAYLCNVRLMGAVWAAACNGETYEDVKRIQRFFKDHAVPKCMLRRVRAPEPIVPEDSDWASAHECLGNFVGNQEAYIDLVENMGVEVPVEISRKLKDLIFVNKVGNSVKNVEPIAKALKALRCETATVADAVRFWIDIKKQVEVPASFVKRFGEIIHLGLTPFACAAYLLHPKFRGEGLPPAYCQTGLQWLDEKSSQYVSAQMKLSQDDRTYYCARLMDPNLIRGVFSKDRDPEDGTLMSAADWWKDMGALMGATLPEGFAELAEQLQLLPASASGTESNMAAIGTLLSDTQNRIGGEKASKLYSIYRTLRGSPRR